MNSCYYCERPVDRAPYDGRQRMCPECQKRVPRQLGKSAAETCDHDWIEVGRSPWTIYYRCAICGATATEPNPLTADDDEESEDK